MNFDTPTRTDGSLKPSERLVRTFRSSREAFPSHCEYACAIERHRPAAKRVDVVCWVCSALLIVGIALMIYPWALFDTFGRLAHG